MADSLRVCALVRDTEGLSAGAVVWCAWAPDTAPFWTCLEPLPRLEQGGRRRVGRVLLLTPGADVEPVDIAVQDWHPLAATRKRST